MPNQKLLEKAVKLGRSNGCIIIATADKNGFPHIATAGQIGFESDKRMFVSGWFCPGTLSNLDENQKIALVSWSATNDIGYQVIGVMEKMDETAMLNGFEPKMEPEKAVPQIERKITLRVDTVFKFSQAPHNDLEE